MQVFRFGEGPRYKWNACRLVVDMVVVVSGQPGTPSGCEDDDCRSWWCWWCCCQLLNDAADAIESAPSNNNSDGNWSRHSSFNRLILESGSRKSVNILVRQQTNNK